MSKGQEIQDWGAREGLPPDTITVLLVQGFNSLADLRHLSPDDVADCFQKTGLLPLAKCLALKKAVGRLSGGGPPPYSPPGRGYSPPDDPFQPGGPSPYDRGFGDPPRQTYHPQEAPYRPAFEQESGYPTQGAGRPRPHHDEPGFPAAMGATSTGDEFRLLLLGKTGSGKRTTGNTIFGEELFQASANFASVTADCELKRSYRDGRKMEIMDSPGLFDTTMKHEQVGTIIIQSVAGMHPGPNAILYVVRVGRYTAEEFSAYNRLKALFDARITKHMIVLFTGGDDLEKKGQSMESLMESATGDLRTVMTECSKRYILFNNFARDPRPQVKRLLDMIRQLDRQNGGPYACPKYGKIGESLEAEVARRMEEVNKKELERQKYVQQLQKQTEVTQQALRKTKEEMERKEREQKRQMEQLAKQQQQKMQILKQQMEEQKLSDKKRLQEERALRERQKEEQQKMREKMEQQRREDQQRFQEMDDNRRRLEAERVQKKREMREERDRRKEREMNKLKDEVVEKKNTGFFTLIGRVLDKGVDLLKKLKPL